MCSIRIGDPIRHSLGSVQASYLAAKPNLQWPTELAITSMDKEKSRESNLSRGSNREIQEFFYQGFQHALLNFNLVESNFLAIGILMLFPVLTCISVPTITLLLLLLWRVV